MRRPPVLPGEIKDSTVRRGAVFRAIDSAQQSDAGGQDSEEVCPVAYRDDMFALMDWGYRYGFQTLFSPEDKIVASRATPLTAPSAINAATTP